MKFYIKEDRWEDFKENHKKYGFDDFFGLGIYFKECENNRDLIVHSTRQIEDLKIDTESNTYAYEGEYRHRTKTYIMDLIADGYIEARRE